MPAENVLSPQKEQYTVTDEGKKVLGIQPTTMETVKNIMTYTPHDKAFNFHDINHAPLHMHTQPIQDFANKITRVDLKVGGSYK